MDRLTTNKDASEMNMMELAYNSCYAKNCEARYRDYEADIDARELAIKLLDKFVEFPNENEFTCDEDFDDFILDSLQYGTNTVLGLIAVFYKNLWAMADLRERLKEYEDLEEQGKLIKLPAAIGDEIFFISMDCPKDYKEEYCRDHDGSCENCHHRVTEIASRDFRMSDIPNMDKIFETRESVEAALKEMSE